MSDKSVFQKIKEHGFKGTMDVAGLKISRLINKEAFYIYQRKPIDSKLIVMESEGDLSDNAYALYDYMRRNGYLQKYHVVWLVDHVKAAEERKQNKTEEFPNTEFVQKVPTNVNLKWAEVLATCKWYIYDHCNLLAPYKKRKDTIIFNLWHGCGIKAATENTVEVAKPDYTLVTGKFFIPIFEKTFGLDRKTIIDLGYPRNDILFHSLDNNQMRFVQSNKLNKYKKVFLWMPTFRRSKNTSLDESYFNSSTGLPILEEDSDLLKLNNFLVKNNSFCIFKIHHLQSQNQVFQKKYSNLIVLKDEEIKKLGLEVYQILPLTDSLISDYSSVVTDYLLLDKPIIYTIDDYEEYQRSRGFAYDNPINYFAGECVKTKDEFFNALQHVINDDDLYKAKRHDLLPQMHTYIDGKSSERILNFLKM